MNPTKLKPYQEAYKIKQDTEDMRNWQLGIYFANSLMSTVLNSGLFKDKSAPKNEYPKQPIFSSYSNDESQDDEEVNERLAVLEMQQYAKVYAKEHGL